MADKRLIEEAFPLKQASIDSVHEKNVRHGHISTLHIWPARRPLAASRAALIAALLPDPETPEARQEWVDCIGGTLVEKDGKPATEGGLLHWEGGLGPDLGFIRSQLRAAYGGRAPKVLDVFAGGGAIPLEAARLGCDVTAVDYNPVAWLLLKCTLDYPHRLAGATWALPGRADTPQGTLEPESGLASHVRYWGSWVLERCRGELGSLFPTLPLDPAQPPNQDNPLCATVAYLWARTVPHPDPAKNGLQVPLLKTLWLCKKAGRERALRLNYNSKANSFEFEVFRPNSPSEVGNGTVTRSGAQCPPTAPGETGVVVRSEYLQRCGQEGRMGAVCTAVIVGIPPKRKGSKMPPRKEYRSPTPAELYCAQRAAEWLPKVAESIPHGLPNEPVPKGASRSSGGSAFTVHLYGLTEWSKLFTSRQLVTLATFVKWTRAAREEMTTGYSDLPETRRALLIEAISAYLALAVDRLADYDSSLTHWHVSKEQMSNTFSRFALPISWDFTEVVPISELTGGYPGGVEWIARVVEHVCDAANAQEMRLINGSATDLREEGVYDAVVTDPPYYDAIPYSDLSDFFYVWLRRTVGDLYGEVFGPELTPKLDELVQQPAQTAREREVTKQAYEDGMATAFRSACRALKSDGRMVIVFAHKQPDAWETLVGAMIRAGFVVTASWPIDTEMSSRTRALNSAALSSSVWLVCRKRPSNAGKGWYKIVQPRMRERITERLRYFWDSGVRGPDFLWAAVGPGLEAFSAFDEVRRNDGSPFSVSEFLKEVRRITTDFALGQIVQGGTEGLDEWTRYSLMHRQNFGDGGAPVGECILLSGAYGLILDGLCGPRGILTRCKAKPTAEETDDDEGSARSGGGSDLRLLRWEERVRDDLGEPHPTSGLLYIDMLHRLMREWATGDVSRVADYAERQGLGQNDLFWRIAQAFAEMSELGSRERAILEALISWGRGRVATSVKITVSRAKTLTLDLQD